MGPRLFSRGEVSTRTISASSVELQWGHGFSAVERSPERHGAGLSDVASMGPRLFSRGKQEGEHDTG